MKKRLILLLFLCCYFACRRNGTAVTSKAPSAEFIKAEHFLYRQNDSAFYYFNKIAAGSKLPLEAAKAYHYMARLQSDAGDYFGSQESLSLSLRKLNPADTAHWRCLASDYNELGLTSIDLRNYDGALPYFDQAMSFKPSPGFKVAFLNNKALAYQKKKAMAQAIAIYDQIINQAPDHEFYARILTNRAWTRWLADRRYKAGPELYRALALRTREKDDWGQNSSYGHLADYYHLTKPDSALYFARLMYQTARKLQSPDDQLEALQKLIKLDAPQQMKIYFTRYQQLSDSVQTARNAAKNQFAMIRYETEKNKADNLKLQQQNAAKRDLLIVTFVVILGAAIGLVLWYRKRQERQQQATAEAIRNAQREDAKKVHDTLGNDVYRILKHVQDKPELDRAWLEEHTDSVYKRTRNLSYELQIDTGEGFSEHLSAMLKSFGAAYVRINLRGTHSTFWQRVPAAHKLQLHNILEELMVNMRKHSQAANVTVGFEELGKQIHILYFDDGKGIPAGTAPKNGLQNVANRINKMGGRFTFESDTGKGLEIKFTFPIA